MIISFDKFEKKQKELKNYKKSILKLIDEFITNSDEDFQKKHNIIGRPYIGSFDFSIHPKWGFNIKYNYGDHYIFRTDDIYLDGLEYKKLQEFMKDPELYKNTKKYNI